MSVPQAVSQVLEIEGTRQKGVFSLDRTLAIALSRVGGGEGNENIVCGPLQELISHPTEAFGEPLHSLVIVGRRLHPLEVEYAKHYAVNQHSWRETASQVYGCALD